MDLNNINLYQEKELPPILYHYTTQQGLLGIINSKSIWATDMFYLNDASEYEYTVNKYKDILTGYLNEIEKKVSPDYNAIRNIYIRQPRDSEKFLKSVPELVVDIREQVPSYICSFSENGDILSQWRGYCPQGNGFSIGFDTRELIERLKIHSFEISQCTYDIKEQEDILIDFIKQIDNEWYNVADREDELKKLFKKCFWSFLIIASRFKDNSFIEEKEWRFSPFLST
jgi:hypothetical protein